MYRLPYPEDLRLVEWRRRQRKEERALWLSFQVAWLTAKAASWSVCRGWLSAPCGLSAPISPKVLFEGKSKIPVCVAKE